VQNVKRVNFWFAFISLVWPWTLSHGLAGIYVERESDSLKIITAEAPTSLAFSCGQVSILYQPTALDKKETTDETIKSLISSLTNQDIQVQKLPLRTSFQVSMDEKTLSALREKLSAWIKSPTSHPLNFKVILTLIIPLGSSVINTYKTVAQKNPPKSSEKSFYSEWLYATQPLLTWLSLGQDSEKNTIESIVFAKFARALFEQKRNKTPHPISNAHDHGFLPGSVFKESAGVFAMDSTLKKADSVDGLSQNQAIITSWLFELFRLSKVPPTQPIFDAAKGQLLLHYNETISDPYVFADELTNLEITHEAASLHTSIFYYIAQLTKENFKSIAHQMLLQPNSFLVREKAKKSQPATTASSSFFTASSSTLSDNQKRVVFDEASKNLTWSKETISANNPLWQKQRLPIGTTLYTKKSSPDALFSIMACYPLKEALLSPHGRKVVEILALYFEGITHPLLPITIHAQYIADSFCLEVASAFFYQQPAQQWLLDIVSTFDIEEGRLRQAQNVAHWYESRLTPIGAAANRLKNIVTQNEISNQTMSTSTYSYRLTRDFIRRFCALFFQPSNLTVIAQGNIQEQDLSDAIRYTIPLFGAVHGQQAPFLESATTITTGIDFKKIPQKLTIQRTVGAKPTHCTGYKIIPRRGSDFVWLVSQYHRLYLLDGYFFLKDASSFIIGYCTDDLLPTINDSQLSVLFKQNSPQDGDPYQRMSNDSIALFLGEQNPIAGPDKTATLPSQNQMFFGQDSHTIYFIPKPPPPIYVPKKRKKPKNSNSLRRAISKKLTLSSHSKTRRERRK